MEILENEEHEANVKDEMEDFFETESEDCAEDKDLGDSEEHVTL